MKVIIIAVGKEKDFAGYELVGEYSARIGHYMPIEWVYVPASDAVEEAERLNKALDKCGSGTHVVLLDEKGKEFSTEKLTEFVQSRLNEGLRSLIFVIGGAHGFHNSIRERAQSTMALSQLTFPHQLVRLILAEQIYRVCTILKGEKYHHA
jgi:23S rRNA (pseudouridine1915-N3)-methyltransferase